MIRPLCVCRAIYFLKPSMRKKCIESQAQMLIFGSEMLQIQLLEDFLLTGSRWSCKAQRAANLSFFEVSAEFNSENFSCGS